MAEFHFLLPFRDRTRKKPLSNIGLTLLLVVSLVYLLLSPTLLEILIIYFFTLSFYLFMGANFFKTIPLIAHAYIIIFFLGFSTLFLQQGEVALVIPLGKVAIYLYDIAVQRTILIWIRGLFSVSIVTLYTTAITMQEFVESLRSLFLPNILVTLILLILRYTPMLYEQGAEVKIAQELRGLSSAPFQTRFKAAASRIGGTLIGSIKKGTKVYEAMVLRGLENPELVRRSTIVWLDLLILPIIAGAFSLLIGGLPIWLA